jgi:hypothetical protein
MTTQTAAKRQPARKPSVAKAKPKVAPTDARVWLRENGYGDVADLIDEVMEGHKADGRGTRRGWWETLAGGKDGRPSSVDGREFPVLASAQRRQGKPVTANAIQRGLHEVAPPVRRTGRWPRR